MKRAVRALVSCVLAVLVLVVAGLPVYVRPPVDRLRHADAILILGGPNYYRYPYGFKLGADGWAPNVVVSNPNGKDDPWLSQFCATKQTEFTLYCFTPNPLTTKGEGREIRRLASEYGWETIIVVTIRPHLWRAKYILENCFRADYVMTPIPEPLSPQVWAFQYVYQTAGWVRAALQPDC